MPLILAKHILGEFSFVFHVILQILEDYLFLTGGIAIFLPVNFRTSKLVLHLIDYLSYHQ